MRRTEDQTARYLAALQNPSIHIGVEIDGYADRQVLKLSLLKLVRKEDARVSLGTDAHHPWQLGLIDFGLAAACLARIPAERIIHGARRIEKVGGFSPRKKLNSALSC